MSTYSPAIAQLETCGRYSLVCLSTQISCKTAVAVHHCEDMSANCAAISALSNPPGFT